MDSTFHVQTGEKIIHTTVTANPNTVTDWIRRVTNFHRSKPTVVFGLDVEWKPNRSSRPQNPAGTLQICAGNRCLIVQLIHLRQIPRSLRRFLTNPRYLFAGVEIESDANKLEDHYGLVCENLYDLRQVARERWPLRLSICPGLKELAREVAGVSLEKPRRVTVCDWSKEELSEEQVAYACLDAYASCEVGVTLFFDLEWGRI